MCIASLSLSLLIHLVLLQQTKLKVSHFYNGELDLHSPLLRRQRDDREMIKVWFDFVAPVNLFFFQMHNLPVKLRRRDQPQVYIIDITSEKSYIKAT